MARMLSRRRVIGAAAAGLAAGPLAAACGVSGGASPGSGASAGAAPTPGLRSGVTLSYMQWGNPSEVDGRQQILKQFNDKFPNLKAELMHVPTDYDAKLDSLLSAGTPPDVFWLAHGGRLVEVASRGSLQDLSALAARDKLDTSDIYDAALKLYQYKSKQYGFPIDFPNQEVAYNLEHFDQAGVKLPPGDWNDNTWNFDRFLDAAKRLTKQEGGQTRYAYATAHTAFRNWWVWITANGGELFNKDQTACTLDQPAATDGFQFLQDLVFKHKVLPTPKELGDMGGAQNAFVAGRVSMFTVPPLVAQLRKDMQQRWDVTPHPKGTSATAQFSCAGGGTGMCMPANGKNVNEAWELLKFSESRPAIETWVKTIGIVPPLKSVASSGVYIDPAQPPKSMKLFPDGARFLHPDPPILRWSDIIRAINDELGALWDGSRSAKEVTTRMKSSVDVILKQIPSAK